MTKRLLMCLLALCFLHLGSIRAQDYDIVRATLFKEFSSKSKKALSAQQKAQALVAEGNVFLGAETEEYTNFQKKFNQYLDDFHDILYITAEVYGLFYEVNKTVDAVKDLSDIVAKHPANVVAVAFSSRRNVVYKMLIKATVDIGNDIKKICFENSKMTEVEKLTIVLSIRPKLRNVNQLLRAAGRYIRYTCMADIYREIFERYDRYEMQTRSNIASECLKQWQWNAGIKR